MANGKDTKQQSLQVLHNYMQDKGTNVPSDFNAFRKKIEDDPEAAEQVYNFAKEQGDINVPDNYKEFSQKLQIGGVGKKKDKSAPTSQDSGQPSAPSEGQSQAGTDELVPSIGDAIEAQGQEEKPSLWEPLNDFNKLHNRLDSLEQEKQAAKKGEHPVPGGPVVGETTKDDQKIRQLDQQIKDVERQLDNKRQIVGNQIAEISKNAIDKGDESKYITWDVVGGEYVDPAKVGEKANELAKKHGVKPDSKASRLLEKELKSRVRLQSKLPEINKRFKDKWKKQFGQPFDKTQKTKTEQFFSALATQPQVAMMKEDIDEDYKQKADKALDEATQPILSEANNIKQDFESEQKEAKSTIDSLKSEIEEINIDQKRADIENQIQNITQQAKKGAIDPNQAEKRVEELRNEYKNIQQSYNQKVKQVEEITNQLKKRGSEVKDQLANYNYKLLEIQNKVNSSLKDQYKEEVKDLEELGGQLIENRSKGLSKEQLQQAEKLYKEASKEVFEEDQATLKAKSEIATEIYTPSINFARDLIGSTGRAIKNYGTLFGSDDLRRYGESVEKKYRSGVGGETEWKDLLDPSKFARKTGEVLGSTLPSLTASATAGVSTAGAGAIPAMVASGLAGWGAETMQIAGGEYEKRLSETNDFEKAKEAAYESLEGQAVSAPLYAVEGLPFVPNGLSKIVKKIKIPSIAQGTTRRVAAGAGAEYGTEIAQESTQQAFSEAIQKGEEWYEGFKNLSLDKTEQVAINVSPTLIMGGAPQIAYSAQSKQQQSPDEIAKNFVKSLETNQKFSNAAPELKHQFVKRQVDKRGKNFATTVLTTLYADGNVDKSEFESLMQTVNESEEANQQAETLNLSDAQKEVYSALRFKKRNLQRKREQEKDENVVSALDTRIKQTDEQINKLASEGSADIAVLRNEVGDQKIVNLADAKQLVNDSEIQQKIANGDINLTVLSDGKDPTADYIANKIKEAQSQQGQEIELTSEEQQVADDVAQDSEIAEAGLNQRPQLIQQKHDVKKPERAKAIAKKAFGGEYATETGTVREEGQETGQEQEQRMGDMQGQPQEQEGQVQEGAEQQAEEVTVEDPNESYSFDYESEEQIPSQLQNVNPISRSEVETKQGKRVRLTFSGQQLLDAGLAQSPQQQTQEQTQQEDATQETEQQATEAQEIADRVESEENVLVREGNIEQGETAFFAQPEKGSEFYEDSKQKLGKQDDVSAYQMPENFKVKDLSSTTFDDYKGSQMEKQAKDEGYDAVKVMEADGSTVYDVFNTDKLQKLDKRLPELRQQEKVAQKQAKTEFKTPKEYQSYQEEIGDLPESLQKEYNELQTLTNGFTKYPDNKKEKWQNADSRLADKIKNARKESKKQAKQKAPSQGVQQVGDESINPEFTEESIERGDADAIAMPDGTEREAEFAIVEGEQTQQSHDPSSFNENPAYPKESGQNANPRNYKNDEQAQQQVDKNARQLNPRQVISDAATPSDGTPIISEDGIVVSGNGRTMAIKRAKKEYPEKYEAYKEQLKQRAKRYGLSEEAVDKFETPILVRVDKGLSEYSIEAIDQYNRDPQKSESYADALQKKSNIVRNNENLRNQLFSIVGQYDRMSDLFKNRQDTTKVKKALMDSNIILQSEINEYFDEAGNFNQQGKQLLEDLLVGSILKPETAKITTTEGMRNVKQTIVTALPTLSENFGIQGYSLEEALNEAVKIESSFRASGIGDFDDFIAQMDIFEQPSPMGIAVNRMLNFGQRRFKSVLQDYNKSAKENEGQSLFGDNLTREQIIEGVVEKFENISNNEKQRIKSALQSDRQAQQEGKEVDRERTGTTQEQAEQQAQQYEQTEEYQQKDQLAQDLGFDGIDQAVNSVRKNLDKEVDRESITEEDIRQAAQESDSISEIQDQSEEQLVEEANEKLDQIEEGKSPAQLEVGGQKITQVINNLSKENRQKVLDKYQDKQQRYQNQQEQVAEQKDEVAQAKEELDETFNKWLQNRKGLGIANDPEQRAKEDVELMNAVKNYAKALAARGVQNFNQFVKELPAKLKENLTNANLKEAWDEGKKGVKKGTQKGAKQQTREATGQKQDRTIEVDEAKALKSELRKQAKAAREALTKQSELAKEMQSAVNDMAKKGKISSKKASALSKRAANVNYKNPKSIQRFLDYAEKVFQDADYAEKLSRAKQNQEKAKKLSKRGSIPVNHREVLEDITKIELNMLNNIDDFNEQVGEYLKTFSDVKGQKYKQADSQKMLSYLKNLKNEIDDNYAQKVKDEFDIDPTMGISGQELYDALNEEDFDAYYENLKEAKQKALGDALEKQADYSKMAIDNYNTKGLSDKLKKIVEGLRKIKPNRLSNEQKRDFIKTVDNIVINDQFFGAEQVSILGDTQAGMDKALDAAKGVKIRNFLNIGGYQVEQFYQSMGDMFKTLFGYSEAMAKVQVNMGFTELISQYKKFQDAMQTIQENINDNLSKLNKRYKNINDRKGMLAEGMVAFLVQPSGRKTVNESLEQRKNQVLQDIERKRQFQNTADEAEMANEIYQEIVNEAETVEQLFENFNKKYKGNYEVFNYIVGELLPKYKGQIKEHAETYWNQWSQWDAPYYAPIAWKRTPTTEVAEEEQYKPPDDQLAQPKQAANTLSRQDYLQIPKDKVINYNLRGNAYKSLNENLFDVYTTPSWGKIRSFVKLPNASVLFGGNDNLSFVEKRLNLFYEAQSKKGISDDDFGSLLDTVTKKIRRYGVSAALGGFTQLPKQVVDQVVTAMFNLNFRGDVMGRSLINLGKASPLLNKFSIGQRRKIRGGTTYETQIEQNADKLSKWLGAGKIKQAAGTLDKVSDIWMKALTEGDYGAAASSWMSYYQQYLKRNNRKVEDWGEESKLVDNDPVRMEAAAYAETMVDVTQVSSDATKMGRLSQRRGGYENVFKSIFLPFSSFVIQARSHMISDVQDVWSWRNPGTATKSLMGRMAGMAAFAYVSTYIVSMIRDEGAKMMMELFGIEPEEKDEKEKKEEIKFKWKKFYSRTLRDIMVSGFGQVAQDKYIDGLNRASYMILAQMDDESVKKQNGELMDFSYWVKDPMRTPFYRYGQWSNSTSMGMYDIALERPKKVIEQYSKAFQQKQEDSDKPIPQDVKELIYFTTLVESMYTLRMSDVDFYRMVKDAQEKALKQLKEESKEKETSGGANIGGGLQDQGLQDQGIDDGL